MTGDPITPYQGDEPYIFVSYSHRDSRVVHAQMTHLRDVGFNLWYDEGINLGFVWRDEIANSIDRSGLILFFVTRHSIDSDNCMKELNYGLSRDRPILAVHLEPTELPPDLALSLSDRQAIFQHQLSSDAYTQKITDAVSTLLDTVAKPVAPTKPAPRRGLARLLTAAAAFVCIVAIVSGGVFLRQTSEEEIDSIAVLPFENASEDPEGAYLSDGITVGLINSLSKLNGLRVVPRRVSFTYKDRDLNLRAIAEELAVQALVTGRVSEIGDTLVVSAELVDAARVEQLWGEKYTRKATDIIAVEKELIEEIIDQLALSLTPEELGRVTDPPTDNPQAYRLYLKSVYHATRRIPGNWERAVTYAQAAVDLDPDFALAHVAVSQAQMGSGFFDEIPWAEAARISRAATQRALQLDDSLPEVHLEVGFIAHHVDWDWPGAETAYRRAIELDANYKDAWHGLSWALLSQGLVPEALEAQNQAVELDPLDSGNIWGLGHLLQTSRRYEEALSTFYEALEIESRHMLARGGIPIVLSLAGRHDEAIEAAEKHIEWIGPDPITVRHRWGLILAWIHASAGNTERARTMIGESTADHGSINHARALMAVGEADAAFEILQGLFDSRHNTVLWFSTHPHNDVFRDDPRYEELDRRINLGARY